MVSRVWDDRLAEVWAAPGTAGTGIVVGTETILTARHVVVGALDDGKVLARVVRPGLVTAGWASVRVLADDPAWDVAVLGVVRAKDADGMDGGPQWLAPASPQPVFARVGTSAEPGCETVGFPAAEVRRTPQGAPVAVVRQSEQATGTLAPAGQGKAPVNVSRKLPPRWMPLDVDTATPGTQAGWAGMSGAAVLLSDGRLVAIVVDAEAEHQQRRLYVVPMAEVLAQSGPVAAALSAALGAPVAAEARDAPLYRTVLHTGCLAPDGQPILVSEAGYRAFGVKPAGVPDEPSFLDYVPRDGDQRLRDALRTAQASGRMLLVAGASASGKSRSAAEAARALLGGHRLLCPRYTSLARLSELPLTDLGDVLLWLDDVERHSEGDFRDTVAELLRRGVAAVATIRRTELQARMPRGDLRNPLGEALTDRDLVVEVAWPVEWSDGERIRFRENVSYPPLLEWTAAGRSPSAWIVAGPALEARLRDAYNDDEWPARHALVRTVLDWYRTGITRPCPLDTARRLLPAYLAGHPEPAEIEDAIRWALESVTGAARTTSQSLLAVTAEDMVTVHDFVRDADARADWQPVPGDVWAAALDQAGTDYERFNVGYAAYGQANVGVAEAAWLPLANNGLPIAMADLGVTLRDSDPEQARYWSERAAEAGDIAAMTNLGTLLKDSEPGRARRLWEQAAAAGEATAMHNLALTIAGREPDRARRLWERAAAAGSVNAMYSLGRLLMDSDPGRARRLWERAAEAGQPDAMTGLGALLKDSEPDRARRLWERAAEAGETSAMNYLGVQLVDSDLEQARRLWERAARAGHVDAMRNLGLLLQDSDPAQARHWWISAAGAGHPGAMFTLAVMLQDSDPEQALYWYHRAAEAGHAGAMTNLGVLLKDSDPDQARRWLERAAEAGVTVAMYNLGARLRSTHPDQARRWYEKAAQAGNIDAMTQLGLLVEDTDPALARYWWERAAAAAGYDQD